MKAVWFGGALSYKLDGDAIPSWVQWLQTLFSSNLGSRLSEGGFYLMLLSLVGSFGKLGVILFLIRLPLVLPR